LAGITALIIWEAQWQLKSKIFGNARYDLALDLCPTSVVGFDGIIPIRAAKLDRVHSFVKRSAELNDPQQIQNDEYDGKNNQSVDPPACFRETWAYVRT
jgi:hypothetical protein